MSGIVVQVNRKPETPGQHGLPKVPADAVRVTVHGLDGDYNRFRTYAKGSDPARAVMIMPLETLRELNAEGWPVLPGDMGENITSQGIPYDDFVIGGRYQVGEAVIEIAEPCLACMNLAALPLHRRGEGAVVHPHTDPHGGELRSSIDADGMPPSSRRVWFRRATPSLSVPAPMRS